MRQRKSDVGDVTLSEGSVLARLDQDGPDSPTSLATLEGVRPQAMAATLADLHVHVEGGKQMQPMTDGAPVRRALDEAINLARWREIDAMKTQSEQGKKE